MEKVDEAIYKALRDDSVASVGIRALLGNTTTSPYNVYHAFLPEGIDFSPSGGSKGFMTYLRVSAVADMDTHPKAAWLMNLLYNITVYARALSTVEAVLRRVRVRLDHGFGVTNPTSQAELHNIKLESVGPSRWDDAFKVHFQTAFYRAWGRDVSMS